MTIAAVNDTVTFTGASGQTEQAQGVALMRSLPLLRYDLRTANSVNATVIKDSPGRLFGVKVFNYAAAARYIRFYDKATAPTVGTDVPFLMLNIGAGAVGPNSTEFLAHGLPFLNGIAISVTTAQALLDATACAVDDVLGSFLYL